MCRLIGSEFKKIFKNKVNIILLLCLFGLSAYMNIRSYNSNYLTYDDVEIVMDGKPVSSNDIYKELEKQSEVYEGTVDETTLKNIRDEYSLNMKATMENDIIDEQRMIKAFGQDYKTYLDMVQNKTMTEEYFFNNYCHQGCSIDKDEQGNTTYPIFYKNDGNRRFYNSLYFNASYNDKMVEDVDELLRYSNFYVLANKSEFLYPDGKNYMQLMNIEQNTNMDTDTKDLLKYFSNKIEKQTFEYQSTVANNLFLNNIRDNVNFLTLIVIAILVANIFANEVRYKTDQIIVPTKVGNTNITIAKCICGLSIAIGVIWIQWIISFLIACILLPLHDLNSIVMEQGNTYIGILNYAYTYTEIIWKGFALTSLCAIVIASITMALSYITRNRFATIIPIILFIFGPLLVPVFLQFFQINFLDFLFPSKAIMFADFFSLGNQYNGTPFMIIDHQVISMLVVCCITYIGVITILTGGMVLHSRKHIVQNR